MGTIEDDRKREAKALVEHVLLLCDYWTDLPMGPDGKPSPLPTEPEELPRDPTTSSPWRRSKRRSPHWTFWSGISLGKSSFTNYLATWTQSGRNQKNELTQPDRDAIQVHGIHSRTTMMTLIGEIAD
ncbi:MAG: hypothetical protein VR70_11050 [Rhodospirillaceae bacterium BRH_c57]|nr:MAG: hypothetical protein VR70_11050 [Rhodospirillaceae bacterium BRH_c57]